MATIAALVIAVITFFVLLPVLGRGAIERLIIQLIITIVVFILARYLLGIYVF